MTQVAFALSHSVARLTGGLFGLWPQSLTMLVLRVTLALPFWRAGQTDWDGWFTLSFGVKARFADLTLHVLGKEYPLPDPGLMALCASVAEATLPALLALGLATRWAALALLAMTGVIQLTFPEGWREYHLPWAAMELAILTFGGGKFALDYVFGLDREPRR